MVIEDNILRYYLRNCYFINGTAYAGKSTMCAMLAERFGMLHCAENYNLDTILSVVDGTMDEESFEKALAEVRRRMDEAGISYATGLS